MGFRPNIRAGNWPNILPKLFWYKLWVSVMKGIFVNCRIFGNFTEYSVILPNIRQNYQKYGLTLTVKYVPMGKQLCKFAKCSVKSPNIR